MSAKIPKCHSTKSIQPHPTPSPILSFPLREEGWAEPRAFSKPKPMPQYNSIQEIGGREEGGDGCNSDGQGNHPASPDGLRPLPPLLPYPLSSLGAALLSPEKRAPPRPPRHRPLPRQHRPHDPKPHPLLGAAGRPRQVLWHRLLRRLPRWPLHPLLPLHQALPQYLPQCPPDAFHLIGHPFGKKLFAEHNLIYMFDQQHKNLRRRIAPNFTPRALFTYLAIQQSVVRFHLIRWLDLSSTSMSLRLRLLCRGS